MKRFLSCILLFSLCFTLFACNDVYNEISITDIAQYDEIWNMPERRADESCVLFPSSVDEKQCLAFLCKHTTYLPVGTGWQVLLEIQYDNITFVSENNRLNELCKESPVRENSSYFDKTAYATVWNWHGCFEYAIVDENKKTVSYIYFQLISKNDIVLNEKYIFKNYEMELTDCETYSIYEK